MENIEIWKEHLIKGFVKKKSYIFITNATKNNITGNLFIKHHKYTDPKLRHIWLSSNLDKIAWGEPVDTSREDWERKRKEKGSILVTVIHYPYFLY